MSNLQDDYELVLSTDGTRKLNFVISEPDLYQELFHRICLCLVRRESMLEIEFDEEKRYDTKLMRIEENHDYRDLLEYFVEMQVTDDFADISERTNHTYGRILSEHKDYGSKEFLKMENYQIMIPPRLGAPEASIAYYSLLAAIREKYRVNTPLIIEGFGRYGLKYAPLLAQLVSQMAPQSLIFLTRPNFEISMHNYRTRKPIQSVRDAIKHITGSVYCLETGRIAEYEPTF